MSNLSKFIFSGKHYDLPKYEVNKSTGIVQHGKKNDYPDYLIELYSECSTHNAIIDGFVNFMVGNGCELETMPQQQTDEYLRELRLIKEVNPDESLDAQVQKVALDYKIHNGVAIESIPSKDGKRAHLYHLDFGRIRTNEDESEYYYSPDWKKWKQLDKESEENGFRVLKPYDPDTKEGLFYWTGYRPNKDIYPLPTYLSAIPYLEVEKEIASFNYNRIKNGFLGAMMLTIFNGNVDEEVADQFDRDFKRKFTGSNGEQWMIQFVDENGKAPEVKDLLPPDFQGQFDQLLDITKQVIFTQHHVTSPMIFGIKTEGQLGGRTEVIEAFELLERTAIEPDRRIIERIYNYLLGLDGRLSFNRSEPMQEKLSENLLAQIATRDELREMAGLPKLQEESFKSVNKDELILNEFSKYGIPAESADILYSQPLKYNEDKPVLNEESFKAQFALDIPLTPLMESVLEILKGDPLTPVESIAKQTGETTKVIDQTIKTLTDAGGLVQTEQGIEVTTDAASEIDEELVVMYRYIKRPDASGAADLGQGRTRDFCRRLLQLDRLYTRSQIESISLAVGRDVWLRRGGFWNDGVRTHNYCRHLWSQVIIRQKK